MLVVNKCSGCGFEWGTEDAEYTCPRCDSPSKVVGTRDFLRTRIISPDGTYQEIETTKPLTLQEMQETVGGYIELTHDIDGRDMFVNEEGLLIGLPYNESASLMTGQHIVGVAILCMNYEQP